MSTSPFPFCHSRGAADEHVGIPDAPFQSTETGNADPQDQLVKDARSVHV